MYFDRFDVCSAYWCALQDCWDSSNPTGRRMYARFCYLERPGMFRAGTMLSVDTLPENAREIYDNACTRLLASYPSTTGVQS